MHWPTLYGSATDRLSDRTVYSGLDVENARENLLRLYEEAQYTRLYLYICISMAKYIISLHHAKSNPNSILVIYMMLYTAATTTTPAPATQT